MRISSCQAIAIICTKRAHSPQQTISGYLGGRVILKLFGMFFLFLILFFVIIVLLIAFRIRATLRSVLNKTDMQAKHTDTTKAYSHHDQEGMIIDVEAEKR